MRERERGEIERGREREGGREKGGERERETIWSVGFYCRQKLEADIQAASREAEQDSRGESSSFTAGH